MKNDPAKENKNAFSPAILAILGGIITLLVGIGTKFWENKLSIEADNRRFQVALLQKAAESNNADNILYSLDMIQSAGLIDTSIIKWQKVREAVLSRTEKRRMDSVNKIQILNAKAENNISVSDTARLVIESSETLGTYIIVAGGDVTFEAARYEEKRAKALKFPDVRIIYRNRSYRTCIGNYKSYNDAITGLLAAKDNLNETAYLVRSDNWCPNPVLNEMGYFECR